MKSLLFDLFQMSRFKNWQKMNWYSEVVISDDKMKADYKLRVEAFCTEGKQKGEKVDLTHSYAVNGFFDTKGYYHVRKGNDDLIEDFLDRLQKAIQKSV